MISLILYRQLSLLNFSVILRTCWSSTQRTWCSSRAYWFSIFQKYAIYFTWNSLWIPIQTRVWRGVVSVSAGFRCNRPYILYSLHSKVPRDINERGRDLDAVLTQYMTFVKPAFEEFCSPVSDPYWIRFRTTYSLCNIPDKEVCRCHHTSWCR